jgi:hypothetical protein
MEIAAEIGVALPERNEGKLGGLKSGIVFKPPLRRVILRGLKISWPQDADLRATFMKAVVKDLKGLNGSKVLSIVNSADRAEAWLSAIGLLLRSANMLETGKLEPRKTGIQAKKFSEANRLLLENTLKELTEHTQKKRFQKLARRWVSKGLINLAGYVDLLVPYTIILDGTSRLALVQSTSAPNWRNRDGSPLVSLLKQKNKLEVLRHIVRGTLGLYPVIDATHPNSTQLKMSKEAPDGWERSTEQEALRFFDKAQSIHEFSDGVKSFVGILSAVLSGNFKVILIDEPEAFLHPPLARRLGVELHKIAREQHAQVFAATHSPDFLMGCIQSGTDISIVRLTYKDTHAAARELKPEQVKRIMRQPLLRSTGVLSALFHDGAVVCESDSDRAFYQELNERLLEAGRGAKNVAFINAQNKQTLERIIKPLRDMGIPAAVVVDADVLSPGEDFSRLMMAAATDQSIRESLAATRDAFFRRCEAVVGGDKDVVKRQLKLRGLGVLPSQERLEFQDLLLRPLAERGIFVVPEGELESWLPSLAKGIGRSDKSKWLVKIFERLGEDPDRPEYIQPDQDGVWTFIDALAAWIAQPKLGMPV